MEFLNSIDLSGNSINNAGLEVVSELPTTGLFEGRVVYYNKSVYIYINETWTPVCSYKTITSDDYVTATIDSNAVYFVTENTIQ